MEGGSVLRRPVGSGNIRHRAPAPAWSCHWV